MGIFDSLFVGGPQIQNGSRIQGRRQNPMRMLMELKRDPVGVLTQAGYKVPKDCRDGKQLVEYLYNSGQIGNGELQMIQNAVSGRR